MAGQCRRMRSCGRHLLMDADIAFHMNRRVDPLGELEANSRGRNNIRVSAEAVVDASMWAGRFGDPGT